MTNKEADKALLLELHAELIAMRAEIKERGEELELMTNKMKALNEYTDRRMAVIHAEMDRIKRENNL